MAADDVPLDDKAKRMRDLLSSFYSTDHASATNSSTVSSKYATLDTINTPSFDADQYMNLLVLYPSYMILSFSLFVLEVCLFQLIMDETVNFVYSTVEH